MAITIVQNSGASGFHHATSPPYTATLPNPVTAGNSIIAGIGVDDTGNTFPSITDNINTGRQYTQVGFQSATSYTVCWALLPIPTAAGTLTVSFSCALSPGGGVVWCHEVSGLGGTPTLDTGATPAAAQGFASSAAPSVALNTAINGCLILALCRSNTNATTGSGFSLADDDLQGDITEYKIQASAGAITVPFVNTPSDKCAVSAIALQPAGSPALPASRLIVPRLMSMGVGC